MAFLSAAERPKKRRPVPLRQIPTISELRFTPVERVSPSPSLRSMAFQREFSPRGFTPVAAVSPAPSQLSMMSDQSMESPQNFQKGMFSDMCRSLFPRVLNPAYPVFCTALLKREQSREPPQNIKRAHTPRVKRETPSPAPSAVSLKSLGSMEPPENFQIEHSTLRMKRAAPSPAPSAVSLKSFRSMEPPQNLQKENNTFSLLTADDFRCSVCTEVLKDPVSIPCGHSYCRQCITSYWNHPNYAGLYACPQCLQTHSIWPELYTNSALAEVVNKLQQYSPAVPDHSYAGPGDVTCDFCTVRKLRAVKSCLNCMASLCEPHVRQHYTVPVLQKHTLVEPEHQDQKLKDPCEMETEVSKQQGKLIQLDDMNNGSLKHVSHVQTQTERQQTQETFEDTGIQPQQDDDLRSSQDKDQSYDDISEKQREVLEKSVENQLSGKVSQSTTRTTIQPYLRALREMLAALYELLDRQKINAQEAKEMKMQELRDRQVLLLKMKNMMMVQKLREKEQKEHEQVSQILPDLLKLFLEMQEELQREQDLQKQQEQKILDLCKQQEQELLELLQRT